MNPKQYKLIIFDLDGTILDTLDDLTDSVNVALLEFGYAVRTRAEIRRFVGNGIRKLMERAVPEGTGEAEVDAVFHRFAGYYAEHCAVKTKPYDGILDMLRQLRAKGCKTAVVSNKADGAAKLLCEKYFAGCFDLVMGERSGIARKPSPDSVNEVVRLLGMEAAEAVYIGDSEVDVKTAENAGMDVILVDWGFRDRELLQKTGAERIVSAPEEILHLTGV